jgi:hypothetical protein
MLANLVYICLQFAICVKSNNKKARQLQIAVNLKGRVGRKHLQIFTKNQGHVQCQAQPRHKSGSGHPTGRIS